MLASVERVLSRFGADKTISAEPALHVVNSVACRQVVLALVDSWTDPKRLSRSLRSLLLNEGTDDVGTTRSSDGGVISDKETDASEAQHNLGSESMPSSLPSAAATELDKGPCFNDVYKISIILDPCLHFGQIL